MAAKTTSPIAAVKTVVARATGRSSPSTAPAEKKPAGAANGAKKATAKKATAKKGTAKKAAPKKGTAKKATAKKATAKKAAPRKAAPKKGTAKKAAPKKAAPKKGTAKKAAPKKAAPKKATVSKLSVRPGEKPWTAKQITDVRATLQSDADRLQVEITAAEEEISQLLRQGGEGAGHDQADVGSNTFERDHEMTMARNARENLALVQAALTRMDEGRYGVCESCGQPIGKMRLQAFPRATLCMECKQRQERR